MVDRKYKRPTGEHTREMYARLKRGFKESLPTVDDRPKTRKDCLDRELGTLENPCPYLSCKFHLALDVTPNGGILFMTEYVVKTLDDEGGREVPEIDINSMDETCALHIADNGETPVEVMSEIVHLTNARLHAIVNDSLEKIKEPLQQLYYEI